MSTEPQEQLLKAIDRVMGILQEDAYALHQGTGRTCRIIDHDDGSLELAGRDVDALQRIYAKMCAGNTPVQATKLNPVTMPDILASLEPEEIAALKHVGILKGSKLVKRLPAVKKLKELPAKTF